MNSSDLGVLTELEHAERELRESEMYLAGQKEAVERARRELAWAKQALSQKEFILRRAIEQEERDTTTVLELKEKIHKINVAAYERIEKMRARAEARRRRAQASPQELLALISAE